MVVVAAVVCVVAVVFVAAIVVADVFLPTACSCMAVQELVEWNAQPSTFLCVDVAAVVVVIDVVVVVVVLVDVVAKES